MSRSLGACLLVGGLLAAGCQQSNGPHPQANNTTTTTSRTSATTSNPAPATDQQHAQNTNPPADTSQHANPPTTANYGPADKNHPANPSATANNTTTGQGNAAGNPSHGAALSPEQFAAQAHEDNLAEIRLAKLAETKAANAEVKSFAQRMVTDHTRLNEQLESVAKQQNLQLPQGEQLNSEHQQLADRLSGLSGDQFDRTYMEHMVPDHQKAIQKFQQEANGGQNPALKDLAAKALPTLQEHLRLAEQAARAVGAPANKTNH
jgi:putative membrane protein